MKKIIIIVLCFVLFNKANTQTARPDQVALDNVFMHINKKNIPTGYLQDYGVALVNKEPYSGVLAENNAIANLSVFRLIKKSCN